jgi:hypothetical protein
VRMLRARARPQPEPCVGRDCGRRRLSRLDQVVAMTAKTPPGCDARRRPYVRYERSRFARLSAADQAAIELTRLAIADLRLAAWLRWMTPLLTALSSLRDASRRRLLASSVSPAAVATLNLRIAVFSDDLTALLRRRRFSFCLLRLIWDLMFATRQPRPGRFDLDAVERRRGWPRVREESGYQVGAGQAKTA